MDGNLKYQQNLNEFEVRIIVLIANDNKLDTLRPLVAELEKKLSESSDEKVLEIGNS